MTVERASCLPVASLRLARQCLTMRPSVALDDDAFILKFRLPVYSRKLVDFA